MSDASKSDLRQTPTLKKFRKRIKSFSVNDYTYQMYIYIILYNGFKSNQNIVKKKRKSEDKKEAEEKEKDVLVPLYDIQKHFSSLKFFVITFLYFVYVFCLHAV